MQLDIASRSTPPPSPFTNTTFGSGGVGSGRSSPAAPADEAGPPAPPGAELCCSLAALPPQWTPAKPRIASVSARIRFSRRGDGIVSAFTTLEGLGLRKTRPVRSTAGTGGRPRCQPGRESELRGGGAGAQLRGPLSLALREF